MGNFGDTAPRCTALYRMLRPYQSPWAFLFKQVYGVSVGEQMQQPSQIFEALKQQRGHPRE